MVFFAPQSSKLRQAYFVNHDTLAGLSPVDQKRMVTFFIACQTEEKLNPKDRSLFKATYYEQVKLPSVQAGVVGVFVFTPMLRVTFGTKLLPRYNFQFLWMAAWSAIGYSFFSTLATNLLESRLLQSDLVLK